MRLRENVEGVLEALEPVFDGVVLTNNGSPRALDTDTLATLVTKVVIDKKDASAVAEEWLKAQGLGG